MSGRLTHTVVNALDWLAEHFLTPEDLRAHQKTGRRGEEDAYFHLRDLGYVMVARNFRSPHRRGEIDLIGWDGDVLCFIEVKTRTTREVKPAGAAVDEEKQRELAGMAREYLRMMPPDCQWRMDVVSVYYDGRASQPLVELFRSSCPAPKSGGFLSERIY
jgi:putative endonuclease